MNHSPRDLPRGLAPLNHRDFALLWVGLLASNLGRSTVSMGAIWITYDLTRSPVLLGLIGLARALPIIVLQPLAGVVADRFDQRRVLFVTQTLLLVSGLALGVLASTGSIQVWHIYALVGFQAGIHAFDASTRQTLYPRLVSREQLPEAATLSSTAARFGELAGPVIGGFAIASLGVGAPFFAGAALFALLIAALAMMRAPTPQRSGGEATVRAEFVAGLRYTLRAPILRGILGVEIFLNVFQINEVMIAIVGREVLGVGPETLGLLLAAPAAGSTVGLTLMIARGQTVRQGRFYLACVVAYAASLVLFAGSSAYLVSLLALALAGMFEVLATVTRHTMIQIATPPWMRGRVLANIAMVTRGMNPLAQTQGGTLASVLGPQQAVLAAAAVLVTTATLTGKINRSVWRFSRHDPAHAAVAAIDASS